MTAGSRSATGTPARRPAAAASSAERTLAIAFAGALVLVTVLAWPVRQYYFGLVPGFLGAYGALLFGSEVGTALVLSWFARRQPGAATLAATYAFSAPLILVNVLVLPGVVFPAGAFAFEVPPWLWAIWHVGWPLGVAFYAWRPGRGGARTQRILGATVLALVVAAIVLAIGPNLPVLISANGQVFSPLLYALAATSVALDGLALIGLLRRRPRPTVELWIGVAVLSLAVDTTFTMLSHQRFSLGSYLARLIGSASGIVVLAALISECARLLEQADLSERIVALAEAMPQLVFATDRSGTCVYVNDAFARYTGRAPADALEHGWVESVYPADLPAALEMVRLAVAGGRNADVELRLRGAEGGYRWHLARAATLGEPDGTPGGLLGTAIDIHERRRASDELARLYEREHRVVETLQAAFLPSFLPQVEGARFDAVYRPASREATVGGDWYDAFVLGEGRIGVCVGDVTGHGLDAASAMIRTRETVRAVATVAESGPADVLALAHRSLNARSGVELTTALYGTFDSRTRRFAYACAGHPPPILVRAGVAIALAGGGLPFGVESEPDIAEHALTLEAGDLLAFYTDGLTEIERDPERGEDHLRAALLAPEPDAAAIVAQLVGDEVRDDVALLLLHVDEAPLARQVPSGWSFRSDDAASAQPARASFLAYVAARGMATQAAGIAELVFGELVGNVVRHAPGPIEIDLQWDERRPLLRVRDRGPGFALAEANLPSDVMSESGRGLFLVRAFAADPIVVPRPDGGTEVVITLPLEVVA